MGLNYFASASPVQVVMPQQQSHFFMHHPHDDAPGLNYESPQARRFAPKLHTPPSLNYLAQASNGIAGRKRSRADIGEDHETEPASSAGAVQPPKPKVEPVMGPGMTLIYPDDPELNISPESQSGTWMETKAETDIASAAAAAVDRPRLPARKSTRRVDVDANLESTSSTGIDPIVLRLGIGWKRISATQATSAAGDETFIKNQYPYVQQPKILLHHEGLSVYVVRSDPIDLRGTHYQWWLFNEDLKSCRLLCNSNEDDVLRRLGNKRQDERGNWIPDILADGQLIYAKDAVPPLTVAADAMDASATPLTAVDSTDSMMVEPAISNTTATLASESMDVDA